MTRMLMWTMLVTTVAGLTLAGCETGQQEATHVPPPDYAEGEPEPMPAPQAPPYDDGAQGQAAPAPVEPELAPAPQAQAAETYTVREGDTLWSIAERVYGDGHMWEEIVDANPELEPEGLRVGQEIVLP